MLCLIYKLVVLGKTTYFYNVQQLKIAVMYTKTISIKKAFPFFLPLQSDFLGLWLGEEPANNNEIQTLLEAPKLFPTLHVQRVKTYKNKQAVGNINDILVSDV